MDFLKKKKSPKDEKDTNAIIIDSLKAIYKEKLLPLEEASLFNEFHSSKLENSDFEAKPMVLLVGQYSTGKTTLIRYLVDREYPGMRIGPEPTTDKFVAVMFGQSDGIIPGNALAVDSTKQFRSLSKFGTSFLNRFQCSLCNAPLLEKITIIDTPGILSGEKQRLDRGYDFAGVLEWFAEHSDRIILLFDAHKLDISDELRRSIEAIKGHEDKLRIVLNKSDLVDYQQLMRVYGALMWSLGKVIGTPEVARVYIGSFWDRPLVHDINRKLFESEEKDLVADIESLPKNETLRKLNDLIKRARQVRVHALIVIHLQRQMPFLFFRDWKKTQALENLSELYAHLQRDYDLTATDFPDKEVLQKKLQGFSFNRFRQLSEEQAVRAYEQVAAALGSLVDKIGSMPTEEEVIPLEEYEDKIGPSTSFRRSVTTPFDYQRGEGVDAGFMDGEWIVARDMDRYAQEFNDLGPSESGKLVGSRVKLHMLKSRLPSKVLARIWMLSDVDADGMLDLEEFALAQHLINCCLQGYSLPPTLPKHLIPPNKRHLQQEERSFSSFSVDKVEPSERNA